MINESDECESNLLAMEGLREKWGEGEGVGAFFSIEPFFPSGFGNTH